MNRRLFQSAGIAAGALLLCASSFATQPAETDIVREGTGDRREQLNKMELAPFPSDAWRHLSDWKNGSAPTPADLEGKVVLICTYKDWHRTSKAGLTTAQRLAERFGKDGLVVIGVHDAVGWDTAEKPATPAGGTFLLAQDAAGEFRKALKVDADPDYYFIDRAGQLRYADVDNASLQTAVTRLLAEKADVAAATKSRLAEEARLRDLENRRSEARNNKADMTNFPDLPWARPSDDDYAKANWPPLPEDPNQRNNPNRPKVEPKLVAFPDSDWFPKKPNFDGRIVIFYVWHPSLRYTYEGFFEWADRFQRQYNRDVVVVGVLSLFETYNQAKIPDAMKDPERMRQRLREIATSRKFDHYLTVDPTGAIVASMGTDNTIVLPFIAIAGTDMKARWWPVEDQGAGERVVGVSFEAAFLRMLENDPGVKIRRRNEDEWLRSQQGNK